MKNRLKMLMIDDDGLLVVPLSAMIGRAFEGRIDLTVMTDSAAAMCWIEQNSPDLVLTDLEMPKVDGFEIIKCAKTRNADCQIVVYSGSISPDVARLARKMGVAECVSKCGSMAELLDALERAYRQSGRINEAWTSRAVLA